MATYPVSKQMCSTCPWREGSPMENLRPMLEERSLKESRVCHSTGVIIVNEATRVQKAPLICRGSRDFQLRVLCGMGFLAEPTDEAWEGKAGKINKQSEREKK
jgi:hypothetical protein